MSLPNCQQGTQLPPCMPLSHAVPRGDPRPRDRPTLMSCGAQNHEGPPCLGPQQRKRSLIPTSKQKTTCGLEPEAKRSRTHLRLSRACSPHRWGSWKPQTSPRLNEGNHSSSQMSAMGGGQEMIPRAPALLPLAPGKEPTFAHKEGIPPPADIPRGPAGERASWGRKASPRVSRCTRRSGLWAHKEPPPSLPS